MRTRFVAALLLAAAGGAFATDEATWPPPEPVQTRMRELQAVIRSPASTMADREAAREELAGLLKSPAGRDRTTPEEAPPPVATARRGRRRGGSRPRAPPSIPTPAS